MGTNSDGSGGKREVICESILFNRQGAERTERQNGELAVRAHPCQHRKRICSRKHRLYQAKGKRQEHRLDRRARRAGAHRLTAGDYDGDGADELAVYVPDFTSLHPAVRRRGRRGLNAGSEDRIERACAPNDPFQYRFGFKNGNLPIVNLTTAGLSRGGNGQGQPRYQRVPAAQRR